MQEATDLLTRVSDQFEALAPALVSSIDRLIMSRVLFQRAKHSAACGSYVHCLLAILRCCECVALLLGRATDVYALEQPPLNRYRMAVGMLLVALRIRRKVSETAAAATATRAGAQTHSLSSSSELEALVAETLHSLSVLVSVDPSLEPLLEKNKIAKAVRCPP